MSSVCFSKIILDPIVFTITFFFTTLSSCVLKQFFLLNKQYLFYWQCFQNLKGWWQFKIIKTKILYVRLRICKSEWDPVYQRVLKIVFHTEFLFFKKLFSIFSESLVYISNHLNFTSERLNWQSGYMLFSMEYRPSDYFKLKFLPQTEFLSVVGKLFLIKTHFKPRKFCVLWI